MEVQPKRPSVKGSPDRFMGDACFDATADVGWPSVAPIDYLACVTACASE